MVRLLCLRCLVVAAAVVGLSLESQRATADDWPQWLGTQRDSVWRETGIIRRFPDGGPTIRWRAEVGGGYSGPAVADGRVIVTDYLTDGDRTPDPNNRSKLDGTERVLCFSTKDGSLIWKHEYNCNYSVSYPAGPRATPTIDTASGRVYTLGTMGDLLCLNVSNGKQVWARDLKKDFGAKTPAWGFCGHPLIDGELLFCLVGGEGSVAVAFDKATGKVVWKALSAREPGYAPPTMIQAGGKKQLLIWHAESINSLNPKTGEVYWSEPLKPMYGMSIMAPRKLDSYLFAGGIRFESAMFKLHSDKPGVDVVWTGAKGRGIGPVNSAPFLEGDHMYGVDGQGELRCVELKTGKHVWTSFDATTGDRMASSATAFLIKNGNRFFLMSETGELIIARLDTKGYHEISRARILDKTHNAFGRSVVWSHPAFAEKCAFARNDKELVCVELAEPTQP